MLASQVPDRPRPLDAAFGPPAEAPAVPPPSWRPLDAPSRPAPHVHGELGEELLHEVNVVAEDVSTSVVIAWFVLVTLLSFAAPVAGHVATQGLDSTFVVLWSVGVLAAVGGAVPFWRGHHRGMALLGVAVAALVPLIALVA